MSTRPCLRVVTAAYPSPSAPNRGRAIEGIHLALSADYSTEVLAPRVFSTDALREERGGITVTRFPYRSGDRPPKQAGLGLWGVASYLRAARRAAASWWGAGSGGAVLAHWVVPSGWVGARVADRLRVPLILYAHGSDLTHYGRLPIVRGRTRAVLRAARLTVCASAELQSIATGIAGRPIETRVVPVGVGPEFGPCPDEVLGSTGAGWRFLFVGDLVAAKGALRVAEAFEALRDVDRVECTVIGDGPCRMRLERIGNVHCLGEATPERVAEEMRRSDALLLPSEREGTPIVVQEAIVSDLPVIATDVGGIAVLFESRRGWTVTPRGEALAPTLRSWMEGGRDRQRDRVRAMRGNERESLSREATVDQLRSALAEVCPS